MAHPDAGDHASSDLGRATAGGPERRIPKVRAGSFFPSLLERRRRVDQALFAVVMVLSHRLAPVLRGWVNYFRHGTSKATFDYLRHYAWRRVIVWLRRKHPRATGKWLRRHHRPGRWPTDGATRLATERDILRQAAKYFAGETRW